MSRLDGEDILILAVIALFALLFIGMTLSSIFGGSGCG